jgi:hypothetical protein
VAGAAVWSTSGSTDEQVGISPSDEYGRYGISVEPGTWLIRVQARGYKEGEVRVAIREGQTAVLDLALQKER